MSAEPTTTYARARLLTGIGGVGTFVVLAATLLALDALTRALDGRGGDPLSDAGLLFGLLVGAAVLALPFDLAGGLVLPKRFGRPHPSATGFTLRWLRGVAVLSAVGATIGALVLVGGRTGGLPLAATVFVAAAAGLIGGQSRLARWVGGLRGEAPGPGEALFLDGDDPGFFGGFTGWNARPVLPAAWRRELDSKDLALLVDRRRRIVASGARRRAVLLAIAWNTAGFTIAAVLPGAGVTDVAGLAATALYFTLWTFVGLLVLPTPSRRATVAADAAVVDGDATRARFLTLLGRLDRLQDDEPERSSGLESVFHPVPSVAARARALAGPAPGGPTAWHLARTALFLSHAGLSLLPRLVHCNAGRPELWVYMPTDG